LLALGFSLILGVARVLNLAHPAFYMLSAFTIYYLNQVLELSLSATYILTLLFMVSLGIAVYQLILAPVRAQTSTVLILGLVLGIAAQELMLIIFGGQFRSLVRLAPGTLQLGDAVISNQHLLALSAVLLSLLGVWFLLFKSKFGIPIRAVAQDREVANLMGIPESRIAILTMAVSVGLAVIAAAMVAPLGVIDPLMWLHPLVIVLTAVILGGLGSIKGSVISAFMLAFIEVSLVFLVPGAAFLRGTVSMIVMLAVLMFKPEGLYGVFMEGER